MIKVLLLAICVILISCGSYMGLTEKGNVDLIIGEWKSSTDSLWVLNFSKNSILDFYDGELIDSINYSISNESCDESYMSNQDTKDLNFVHMKSDPEECKEIVGLTNSTLSYRDSSSGRLFVFNRVN